VTPDPGSIGYWIVAAGRARRRNRGTETRMRRSSRPSRRSTSPSR